MSQNEPEILDEQIAHYSGKVRIIHRWLRGHHPHLGILTHGISGPETFQTIVSVCTIYTYTVEPAAEPQEGDPAAGS